MRKNYTNISDTIDEMLTYFSRLYSEHDNKLQESKEKPAKTSALTKIWYLLYPSMITVGVS